MLLDVKPSINSRWHTGHSRVVFTFACLAAITIREDALAAAHDDEHESEYIERIEVIPAKGPCQSLATYKKAQGVDFVPGKSVKGRDVVPADLQPGPTVDLPSHVEFNLLIEPVDARPVRLEGNIGTIKTDLATGAVSVFDRTYIPSANSPNCP